MDDDELKAAMTLETDRLLPRVARLDAALSLAAAAPRIGGHVRSAAAAGNWWAVAGWSLRALDTTLIEIGHIHHDVAQRQAGVEYWRQGQRAAREAVPDDDRLSERNRVLAQWARQAPGGSARRGNALGAGVYVVGRAALGVWRRRAAPVTYSVLPVPSRPRRAYLTALAAVTDLARYLSPARPDHRDI